MVKNKVFTLLLLLTILISACGTKESLQRDLIVQTAGLDFKVNPTSNLTDTTKLAEINTNPDLSTVIEENTTNLSASNLKSVRIIEFTLNLKSDTVDEETVIDPDNNFQAFEYIRVEIKSANEKLLRLGAVSSGAIQSTTSIQLPLTNSTSQELVKYLTDGTLTYIITGVNGKETTKIMNVSAVAKYKLTLGI